MAVTVTTAAHCASCFASKPGNRHVDFGSVYDGPTFRDAVGQRQSIDDLVICDDCIREASAALAIDENPVRAVELERDQARDDARRWQAYAEGLEGVEAARPVQRRRGRGRPRKRPARPAVAA